MDKKDALRTLITHTTIFADDYKARLLAQIDNLSAEEIETLGKFLALEKKKSIENNQEMVAVLDQALERIEQQEAKS